MFQDVGTLATTPKSQAGAADLDLSLSNAHAIWSYLKWSVETRIRSLQYIVQALYLLRSATAAAFEIQANEDNLTTKEAINGEEGA